MNYKTIDCESTSGFLCNRYGFWEYFDNEFLHLLEFLYHKWCDFGEWWVLLMMRWKYLEITILMCLQFSRWKIWIFQLSLWTITLMDGDCGRFIITRRKFNIISIHILSSINTTLLHIKTSCPSRYIQHIIWRKQTHTNQRLYQ